MVIDLKNVTIKIKDGGSNSLDVKIGEGTLTYDEKRNIQYVKDRGRLDTVRLGDEEPVDVRLDFTWEFLTAVTSSGTPTIEDALKHRGEASHWVSTSSDSCEPYAVDIELKNVPPCDGTHLETILLQDFRYESLNHDAKAGSVSVSGKCNVTEASVSRGAAFS